MGIVLASGQKKTRRRRRGPADAMDDGIDWDDIGNYAEDGIEPQDSLERDVGAFLRTRSVGGAGTPDD